MTNDQAKTSSMTNQETLQQAIQLAIKRGWLPYFAQFDKNMTKDNIVVRYPEGSSSINFDYIMKGHIMGVGGYNLEPYSIIFNHGFTKAIWGNDPTYDMTHYVGVDNKYKMNVRPRWIVELQQMVIAEDPIKYLGDNLPS